MGIENIHIENFMGFSQPVEIADMRGRNLIIYGENGSGKSSFYEALRLVFYGKNMEEQETINAVDETEKNYLKKNWLDGYTHHGASSFTLKINGTPYENAFGIRGVCVFMLSLADVRHIKSKISLKELFSNLNYPVISESFVSSNADKIIKRANSVLKNQFYEKVTLSLDGSDKFNIIIKDTSTRLEKATDLPKFFNEAKLTIIVLLLELIAAKFLAGRKSKKILVLDDVISSMDMANRSFLINFILNQFADFQKIILTHNAGYYNLFTDIIHSSKNENWLEQNMVICGDTITLTDASSQGLCDLRKKMQDPNENPKDVANEIRQYFEMQIQRLALRLNVGQLYKTGSIIEQLQNGKGYYKIENSEIKTAEDLVGEMESKLKYAKKPDSVKVREIENLIKDYSQDSFFKKIGSLIKGVHLYQKLILHQLSHGHKGVGTFSNKEFDACLILMGKLDKVLKERKIYYM